MKKLYLLEWYLEREEQKKQILFSDFNEAENYYLALASSLNSGWASLEELEENEPSKGFERGVGLYYKEFNGIDARDYIK